MDIESKVCCRCKIEKTADKFYKLGSGLGYSCIECIKKRGPSYKFDTCPDCGDKKMETSKKCYMCGKAKREIHPPEFIAKVKELYANGLTTWKIAKELGTNQQKIYRCLVRNGVELRENSFGNDGKLARDNKTWRGYGEISGSFYGKIKAAAKLRDLECPVTIEEIWELFEKQSGICRYSGLLLTFPQTNEDYVSGKYTASLDRIDSSKGYTLDNVEWVHRLINIMKSSLTSDEFILVCSTVGNVHKDYDNPEKDMNTMNYKVHRRRDVTQ